MCHLSPTVHLAWAILSCGLQVFLIQHLWRYDRFKCLAWTSGRQPGAFKRIMTYSYLTSVPGLVVYSVSMAVLKYRNGYTIVPGHGIIPTPFQLWPAEDQNWLQPLYILFSVVWGLELVTHLEELTFWLFLIHQGPERRDWFSSTEFKTWGAGSFIAMVGLPLTAVFTRENPLTAEAWIFLVGSAASTVVTAVFFVVLIKFPTFLRRVKKEGAAGQVVLRLVKFHELNILRVIFRIFMTVPLLILGVDGVLSHHIINENALWTDLLAFCSAVGLIVSSTMTLLIFFPRSLAEDSNWQPRTTDSGSQSHISFVSANTDRNRFPRPLLTVKPSYNNSVSQGYSKPGSPSSYTDGGLFQDFDRSTKSPSTGAPILTKTKLRPYNSSGFIPTFDPTNETDGQYEMRDMDHSLSSDDGKAQLWNPNNDLERGWNGFDLPKRKPEAESPQQDNRGGKDPKVRMMELGQAIDVGLKSSRPPRPPRLHPYITSFTSPIDLMQMKDDPSIPHAV